MTDLTDLLARIDPDGKLGEFPAVRKWERWSRLHRATYAQKTGIAKADAALAELAELLEDSVPKSWDGLLVILDDIYPAQTFGGVDSDWHDDSRDIGPRLVTLARHLDAERSRAEKAEGKVHGLATAAKTGMVAANKVIELAAEVERWKWIATHDVTRNVNAEVVVFDRDKDKLADLARRAEAEHDAGA